MPLACECGDLNCILLFKILTLWKIVYLFGLERKDHPSVEKKKRGSIKEIKVNSRIPGKLIQFKLTFRGGENM